MMENLENKLETFDGSFETSFPLSLSLISLNEGFSGERSLLIGMTLVLFVVLLALLLLLLLLLLLDATGIVMLSLLLLILL